MGANEQRVDSEGTSIDGFVTLLNDFAALPEQALSQRARGRDGLRRVRHAPSSTPRTAPMLSRPRAGFAGFLAILLVGGLGFAIWTEPHGCLGCDDALMVAPSAQASDTARPPSRFQYTADLGEILKQEPSQWALSLDQASKTAEVHGEELSSEPMPKFAAIQIDASGAPSPMTTSATGQLYQQRSLTEARPPRHSGRLPAVVVEVSDAKPKPVTLAAANEIFVDLWKTIGDSRLIMDLIHRDMETLKARTGSRIPDSVGSAPLVVYRPNGEPAGPDFYRNVRIRLQTRLNYLETKVDITDLAMDSSYDDVRILEEQVKQELAALDLP